MKDAVLGLKDFYANHPSVFAVQMGAVLEGTSRLMVDEVWLVIKIQTNG